jgi:hypothetical protein
MLGHQCVLPCLFLLAGSSCMFMLQRHPNLSWASFTVKRAWQLLIPAFVAFFIFVIPKHYMTVESCQNMPLPSIFPFPWIWFRVFFTYCFKSKGFEWLWFAIVLFAANVLLFPVLKQWAALGKETEHPRESNNSQHFTHAQSARSRQKTKLGLFFVSWVICGLGVTM